MLWFATLLALLIGCILGLLGGGGTVLTLPILMYVMHIPTKQAITTSLCIVATASIAALIPHARNRRVEWNVGFYFGLAGICGAFLGGFIAKYLSSSILLIVFALLMLVTGTRMLRNGSTQTTSAQSTRAWSRALLLGVATGFLSGLVGAGGGFIIVPALIFFMHLPIAKAVATSLLIIAMQSFAGFLMHVRYTSISIPILIPLLLATTCGSLLGSLFYHRTHPRIVRKALGWLIVLVALLILYQQLLALMHT